MRNRRYKYTVVVAVLLLACTATAPGAAVWVDDFEPYFGRPATTSPQELPTSARQELTTPARQEFLTTVGRELKIALQQETYPNSPAEIAPSPVNAVVRQDAATPFASSDVQLKSIGENTEVRLDQLRRVAGFMELSAYLDDVMTIIVGERTDNSCNKQLGFPRFAPLERGFISRMVLL